MAAKTYRRFSPSYDCEITVHIEHDDSSDVHDLEASVEAGPSHYTAQGESPADAKKYHEQDKERLRGWYNDDWTYVGVYAEVKIIVEGTLQSIRSPGLWGIESDSGDYFEDVAKDELSELEHILKKMGITCAASKWKWNRHGF